MSENLSGLSYNEKTQVLSKINKVFKNEDKKSLTDILIDFQYMSNDFAKLNDEIQNNKIIYSNPRFDLCTLEEQKQFIDNQLQLIETLVTDKIWYNTGVVWNWYDIFALMHNKDYAKVEKAERKVIFSTSESTRPIGDQAYIMWNGLQIIDIDIKNAELAKNLKEVLFNELNKYQWFLGVSFSSSRKSLHVWTKIVPISRDLSSRRVEFRCNFRHKYSYIYITLLKYCSTFGYTKEDIISYLDNAMAKPQQGIYIASDNPYVNTNFMDLRLNATFEAAIENGIESINWITHPDLREVFAKLEWFNNENFSKEANTNLDDIENRDFRSEKHGGPIHYKHNQRWQLANTLVAIYKDLPDGEQKAYQVMCEICADTSKRELKGDIRTAALHNKPISKWAIKELNENHGFKLKLKQNVAEFSEAVEKTNEELKNLSVSKDPIRVFNNNVNRIDFFISKDQYLSDIKEDILKNLSKITLIEAGAGYGKTEMIKAFKAKTLLVLPFTSIIKAKIELDEVTSDWLYYYGSKKPTLDELVRPGQSMSMTIDKFSHLNLMELDEAGFEYIVIDESHLLFTSSYRDVMSPTIQRLANCSSKVILMTGTPTAEVLFFPKVNHIVVTKEESRIKEFTTYFCPSKYEQIFDMVDSMVQDIKDGVKIIWPTNKGSTYFEQITTLVSNKVLEICPEHGPVKTFYYKKSNYGDDSMDNINKNKSIGDNDIIGCTTYLSVGIDICDTKRFHIYFNEPMISQYIEQYANRIRRNDLYIKMFLPLETDDGNAIDWNYVKPIDLKIEEKEKVFARDLIRTINDMIERNLDESKYNPMILSMLSENKFLKYDEIDCKYYIDETAYKLHFFEDRYIEYGEQWKVIKEGMEYYGYNTSEVISEHRISDVTKEDIKEELKRIRHKRWDEYTQNVRKFLSHITDENIDIYKEVLKGNYTIFKDDEYKEERGENNLYVESIEVIEKNIKIVLSLYRFYTIETIKEIYEFCIDSKSNRLNHTKLDRIRKFVNIEYNRKKKKLDFPILKYVKDAQEFALSHLQTTKDEIKMFNARYATTYANSIEGLVVQDQAYIDEIYQLVAELWPVIIVESKPNREGKVSITPFKLQWERKDILRDVYGDSNTHEFFIQVLEDEMDKKIEEDDVIEDLPEFERKGKLTIDDIKEELPNIIHKEFEYDVYSDLDDSNNRFMRRQKNMNNVDIMEKIKHENESNKEDDEKVKTVEKNSDSLFTESELNGLPI